MLRGCVHRSAAVVSRAGAVLDHRGVEVRMAGKDELGRRGEDLAARFLEDAGYSIVERNWRCRQGEIDIVARIADTLVFVEVKTRSGLAFGHPFEAITATKLTRLRGLAAAWCAEHNPQATRIRLDAIAVIAPRKGTPVIEHLLGVF
jgi:putative endonuclease